MKIFRVLKLAIMCKRADKMYKVTGKRYHVIENNGKLMVVNNSIIKAYNKKTKTNKINIYQLLQEALYSTK